MEGDADEANPYGVTCVDARNGFNELSRKVMLLTVRHRWSKGARFAFNCYRHACILIVCQECKECLVILSEEGVTQGDPLSMILYGLRTDTTGSGVTSGGTLRTAYLVRG